MLEFIPILSTAGENKLLLDNPACRDVVIATMNFYKVAGFIRPWIGYIVMLNEKVVGSAGFKGKPVDNQIEIAYGTIMGFQNKGIGTQICAQLVALAKTTDLSLTITARTLPDNLSSIAVLRKNGFVLRGMVWDKEDGDVQEWLYKQ